MWGVWRFKRGFGGEILRYAGAWDKGYYPLVLPLARRSGY
jgi:lipid II:glycine glycyltransferase (peptidoglycan interpeptide bridge formation enzyme)